MRGKVRRLWLPLALLVSGCASNNAEVATGPGTSISETRRALLLSAADGPVPLLIDAVPPVLGSPDEVARLAAAGAADYTHITFVPETGGPRTGGRAAVPPSGETAAAGEAGARLVFRFADPAAGDPGAICRGDVAPAAGTPPSPPRLHAVFCQGDRLAGDAVGVAKGESRDEVATLVRQTTATLFPGSDWGDGSSSLPGLSVFGGVGGYNGGHSGSGIGLGGFGVVF